MNNLNTSELVILLTLIPFTAFASDQCARVTIVNDKCSTISIKTNLDHCEDELIGVSKPKCSDGEMKFTLRGKESDYQITMKQEAAAPDTPGAWRMTEQKVIAHRSTAKLLPKTEHEKIDTNSPAILTEAKNAKPEEPKSSSAFIYSAYFDGYIQYNFNHPGPANVATPTSPARAQNSLRLYDTYANQFALSLAELSIKHVRKETTFLLDLDFGSFADTNTQVLNLQASAGPTAGASDEITKHIGQVILTYTPESAPSWIFEAGKMPTHLGLELMKAKENWNYTRSTVFSFGLPLWHTGIHIGDAVIPNRLTLNAYIYNGWNSMIKNNYAPTFGTQIKWTPAESLTAIYNYIGGAEQPANAQNWKQVHEVNFSYTLNPTLSTGADFIYGQEKGTPVGDAYWYGAQLGFKWQTSPKFYLSPRAEIYRDPQGYTLGGVGQSLVTYTLTASTQVVEGLEVRLEGRLDHSTASDRFVKPNGPTADQPTMLAGILYSL